MSNYPLMTVYALYEEEDMIMETSCTCIEKALDYFKEMGYDMYENKDLHVKTLDKRNQGVCVWDSWHPNY